MQRLSGPVRFQKNPDGNALYRQMDYQRVSASELYNDDVERGKPSHPKHFFCDQPQSKMYPYCFLDALASIRLHVEIAQIIGGLKKPNF